MRIDNTLARQSGGVWLERNAAAGTKVNGGTNTNAWTEAVNPKATDNELSKEGYSSSDIKDLKRTGKVECSACADRSYQDGSNDPGVSFKSPTKLSPEQAATAVVSHENEHVTRNKSKAEQEGREVTESSVRIFTSVCPECGKSYVSGGETRTVTKKKAETDKFAEKFFEKNVAKGVGKNLDEKVG